MKPEVMNVTPDDVRDALIGRLMVDNERWQQHYDELRKAHNDLVQGLDDLLRDRPRFVGRPMGQLL